MTTAILHDGTRLEFPDETPQAVIDKVVKSHMQPETSVGNRVLQGMKDPVDAGAQMLTHILPQSVVDAGNKANNWLADKTGMFPHLPENGVDGLIEQNSANYKSPEGIDYARLSGNILSPVNLAVASRLPAAAGTLGRIAAGAGAGSVMGAMQPVENGDYAEEKKKQILTGAATGGVLSGAGAVAGKVISPSVRADVKTLIDQKITPTIGQILGGGWQTAENKATSIPIIGDFIKNAQRRATGDLNDAAINRSLSFINEKLPNGVKGRDAITYADTKLSNAYDKVLDKIGAVKPDAQFAQDIKGLTGLVQNLPAESQDQFNRILQNEIKSRLNPQGFMTSEGLKAAESNLGTLSRGYSRAQDYDTRQLGTAIQEAQSTLRSMLERVAPPGTAAELKAVNTAQANFYRPQRASANLGAEKGEFTADQLQSAVKALDPSKNKKQFTKGTALMQDLSEPAKSVLTSYPDSGTAGRALLAGAPYAVGAAYASPLAASLAAGAGTLATLPYTGYGQKLASILLTGRQGQTPKAIANAVQKYAPALSPAAVPLALQLMEGNRQ